MGLFQIKISIKWLLSHPLFLRYTNRFLIWGIRKAVKILKSRGECRIAHITLKQVTGVYLKFTL